MAKKDGKRYCCIECGYVSLVPSGKCPRCGAWGTLEEEIPVAPSMAAAGTAKILTPVDISTLEPPGRLASGFGELDRVLGGGWVPGGVVLLGGQPGIGKSTLLLQVCGHISAAGCRVLYISGEESPSQLGLRAKRLKILHDGLDVCCHTVIDDALALAKDHSLIVVDSVQAMRTSQAEGWPGTPTQVRATAQVCVNYAKEHGVPMVLVGHITKEGRIAGPMLLEHMVDAVIMFADDNSSVYRTLRASKNRYGGTDEMGIFEMRSDGLTEVPDPSYLYWNRSDGAVSGVVMTVIMEGSRPLVAEIQTLASESSFAYPKRAGIGLGANKIGMPLRSAFAARRHLLQRRRRAGDPRPRRRFGAGGVDGFGADGEECPVRMLPDRRSRIGRRSASRFRSGAAFARSGAFGFQARRGQLTRGEAAARR